MIKDNGDGIIQVNEKVFKMSKERLSQIINNFRNKHHLTQEEFGLKCGLSKAYISILENERDPNTNEPPKPSLETFEKLAYGIGITRDELISRVEGKSLQKKFITVSSYSVPIIKKSSDIWDSDVSKQQEIVNVSKDVYKPGMTFAYRITDEWLSPIMQKNDMAIIWINSQYSNGDYVLVLSQIDNSLHCYRYYKFDYTTVLFGNLSVNPLIKDTTTSIVGKVVLVQKSLL